MAESRSEEPNTSADGQPGRRLDSWKEIASYLNRDVTTVRRWEKREGLPVHRHRHAALGSVYAFTGEIDSWQSAREYPAPNEEPLSSHEADGLAGRQNELRRLHEYLGRALEGRRQTVFIAGELGIGKTALTRTFLSQLPSDVRVAVGQCVEQYGKGDPYLPVVDALERLIRDPRSREAVRVVAECAPSWMDQLSLPSLVSGRRRRKAARAATVSHMVGELTDAIEALAATAPLLLLLEDLHWSDQATVEFISRLARRPERARLLVIGTYRAAELFESGSPLLRVVTELRVHLQAAEIELVPLSQAAVGELIARGRSWNDLRGTAAFLRRWSGNPLFLIHFLAHLERAGEITERDGEWYLDLTQPRTIPNSLRLLIEEQVDRLDPRHRQLLEIASVVGETFSAALVAQTTRDDVTLVERALEDLCKRSYLVAHREATRFPDGRASASYAFMHEFYRQVVYERLPKATSIDLHRHIGSELEAAYATRPEDVSSELAMHFDRGHDFRRAVEYYSVAAENAVARNADREAQIALSKAAELVVQLAAGEERDQLERRLGTQLAAEIERMQNHRRWISSQRDDHNAQRCHGGGQFALLDGLICLSSIHGLCGDLAAAKEIGDRAAAIGHRRKQRVFEATAQQAYVRLLSGEFANSRSLVLQALAAPDGAEAGQSNDRARCLLMLAWTSWYLGCYDDLRDAIENVLKVAGESFLALSASVVPLLEWLRESQRSHPRLRSALRAEQNAGDGLAWPSTAVRGWVLVRRRRFAQGLDILRESVDTLRTMGLHAWLPCTLVWLTEGLQASAQTAEAITTAESGLEVVRRTGARCCDAELYRVRGEALLSQEGNSFANKNRDAAEASFWASITVARQQEARTLELRATLSLCRLLHDASRQGEALRTLRPICDQFAASDDTPELAAARTLLSTDA